MSGSPAESLQQTVRIERPTLSAPIPWPADACAPQRRSRGGRALELERVEACPLCGSGSTRTWRSNCRDWQQPEAADRFGYLHCSACSAYFLSPRPLESELERIYFEGYGPYRAERRADRHPGGRACLREAPHAGSRPWAWRPARPAASALPRGSSRPTRPRAPGRGPARLRLRARPSSTRRASAGSPRSEPTSHSRSSTMSGRAGTRRIRSARSSSGASLRRPSDASG